jgi:hypothetical protein
MLTIRLVGIFTAFLCACANGYDGEISYSNWSRQNTNEHRPLGSLLTGIIAMEQFQDVFHSGTEGPTVSLLFSLYTVSVLLERGKSYLAADRGLDIVALLSVHHSPLSFRTSSVVVRLCSAVV